MNMVDRLVSENKDLGECIRMLASEDRAVRERAAGTIVARQMGYPDVDFDIETVLPDQKLLNGFPAAVAAALAAPNS